MEESSKSINQPALAADASRIPEDLVFEILSRVPYSSLCRFKCASRSWLALCSDPALRRKSPQTLSGFFYCSHQSNMILSEQSVHQCHYINVLGKGQPMIDPSLSFLPTCTRLEFIDSSNGLLLCRCMGMSPQRQFDYVVSNPATERYSVLPYKEAMVDGCRSGTMCLGFDPAMSPHFGVLMLREDQDEHVSGVEIYSSETGDWTYRQSQWDDNCEVNDYDKSVFFNGVMHFATWGSSVVTVDLEGKNWRTIPTPNATHSSFVGASHGQLYLMHNYSYSLSVWVLEDYGKEQWIHKHTVNTWHLQFGQNLAPSPYYIQGIAIHLELNLIFFLLGKHKHLISYNMDSKTEQDISTLGDNFVHPCLPYIPCYSEWLSDGQ
jgi:F-box interacting protein